MANNKKVAMSGAIYVLPITASVDSKYGPYSSVEEAWELLGPDEDDIACIGLTVGIQPDPDGPITEYWFKDACESVDDLVPKGSDLPAGTVVDPNYVHTDNNFTTAEKTKLAGLENYDDTVIVTALDGKVDKVAGKGLSSNDYTTIEKDKLATVEEDAQENIIEEIQVNGTALTPDANKAVDIPIADYTIEEVSTTTGYVKSYQLKKDNTYIGAKINIPKDLVIESGSVETVVTPDVPYEGAVPGDKYIDLVLNDGNKDHIYIPVNDLVDVYTAGNGIDISNTNEISIKLKSESTNGLATDSNGLSLAVATTSTAGAMSALDKTKLDGIEAGAEVNVNPDWDAVSGDAEILNKPTTIAGYGITDAYTKTETDSLLDDKVDKVEGKGLSTEDYTTAEKTKLSGIEEGAEVNIIETVKVNGTALTPDADRAIDVTVPTAVSDLTNDLNFIDNTVNDLVYYTTTADLNTALDGKADVATTLAGYGITDAYTKTEVDNKISSVFTYKGSVNSYSDLPSTDLSVGDVYNVATADPTHHIKAGDNVAWTGSEWDVLGGEVDLSNYYTKTQADDLLDDKVDKVTGKQLSTEDFTTALKNKLDDVESGAQVNIIEEVQVNGVALTPDVNKAVDIELPDPVQVSTVPTASASNVGRIIQYTGATNADYTNGYFYQVHSSGGAVPTYNWVRIDVQEVVGTAADISYDNTTSGLIATNVQSAIDEIVPTIPTTTSDLTNDSGFIDKDVNDLTYYTTTSDLNTALNGKADSATTLVGYGITDAYTKTEIDGKISSVYRYKGSVVIYADLPTTGQVVGDVYNIQDADPTHHVKAGDNVAWTGSSWDVLGGEIDFSSYYTKTQTDDLLDDKVDKVSGKQLSTEDYTTVEKNKLAGIESNADVNVIEIVKVDGTALTPDANKAVNISLAGKINEPVSEGTSGQVLTTDGNGGRTWTTVQGGSGGNAGYWTTPIARTAGSTTCTINDVHITTTCAIEEFTENASNTQIAINSRTLTEGRLILRFDALEEATNFKLHIWEEEAPVVTYTVSFNTHGGSSVESQTVVAGDYATEPATDPTKSGYTFDGWYTNDEYTTEFDFANTAIEANTIVHAKWNEIVVTHTVTFDTHGGSSIASQTVNDGEKATRPATDPTKTDYTFDDWYTDTTYTTTFDFTNTIISADTTIHANWEVIPSVALLTDGNTFTTKMKKMFNSSASYTSEDTNITSVTFNKVAELPSSGVDVSANNDGSILLTHTNGAVYVNYTADTIKANVNSSFMFYKCTQMTAINNLSDLDVSSTENMQSMFAELVQLTSLDLSNFDTSSATNMRSLFGGCESVTSLDVTGFDTSKATDMASMFARCKTIPSLDLSNFNTSNVTDMSNMFDNCLELTTLDLSSFDTRKVETMASLVGCTYSSSPKLQTVNLSSFDTSNVTSMSMMFSNQKALTSLDISNFDASKVTVMTMLFSGLKCSPKIPKTTGSLTNTTSTYYGASSSTSASAPTGYSFILAD